MGERERERDRAIVSIRFLSFVVMLSLSFLFFSLSEFVYLDCAFEQINKNKKSVKQITLLHSPR